jgi:hypothetical protein
MKDKILELINECSVQENSSTLSRVVEEDCFDELAEEIVKLFAIPVVVKSCVHDYETIMFGSTGTMLKCKKCGKKV